MGEFLVFIDEIGRTTDGEYIYRFDFSTDTEIAWGEFFNVVPSAIIPDLQPDKNTLSKSAKAVFPREMIIAKKSFCFSMQDCIDGIMPLMFCEIDDSTIEYEEKPFFIRFGEKMEDIEKKLSAINVSLFDFENVEKGDDSAIDTLIDAMDNDDLDSDEF